MEKLVGFHLSSTYVLPTMYDSAGCGVSYLGYQNYIGSTYVLPCENLFTDDTIHPAHYIEDCQICIKNSNTTI